MDSPEIDDILKSLTAKQHEALALAARHLTSKQIAHRLGVAPVTIDKRIEGVRAKLGSIPRASLLQIYGDWCEHDGQTIADPIILGANSSFGSEDVGRPSDNVFVFEDSLVLDARASWERPSGWRQPGFSPSDLGVAGKLLAMLGGAVAMLMAAVLSIAFADALMSMFGV